MLISLPNPFVALLPFVFARLSRALKTKKNAMLFVHHRANIYLAHCTVFATVAATGQRAICVSRACKFLRRARDPALVDLVRQCLATRSPLSKRTGRTGIAPDRLICCCVMKHLKGWSFRDLEREPRSKLVYRRITQLDAEATPDFTTARAMAGHRHCRTADASGVGATSLP